MAKIIDIEGIGEVYTKKFVAAGIVTTAALLKKGATPAGRKEIEKATGLGHKLVLKWVNYADLFRIKGVKTQYAELLEAAGVDTVPELAQRKPESLVDKMAAVNAQKNLVRQLPTVAKVKDWVDQAKKLSRVVTY